VDSTRVLVAGQPRWLHDCLTEPAFLLVLCGPPGGWDELALDTLRSRYGDVLAIRRLTADHGREDPDLLVDIDGFAGRRLGVRGTAHLLVRPDGHVASRQPGCDLTAVTDFLSWWLVVG